jgi:hypothetical protein
MRVLVLQSAEPSALSEAVMMDTRESQFRAVRIMHRTMLAAVILYAFTAERLARPSDDLPAPMLIGLGVTAAVTALVAFGYQKKLPSAIAALRRDPQDAQAVLRWRQAHIVTMILLVSVALFGFTLRFLGGSFWIALPFYAASFLLLLLWAPRPIVDAIGSDGSSSTGK